MKCSNSKLNRLGKAIDRLLDDYEHLFAENERLKESGKMLVAKLSEDKFRRFRVGEVPKKQFDEFCTALEGGE